MRRKMVERVNPDLPIGKQCKLLSISRSSFYYTPKRGTAMNLLLLRENVNVGIKCCHWGRKGRTFWGARFGACGSHIASAFQGALDVRPTLLGSFSGSGEACPALAEAVTCAVHLQLVDVMGQSVQKRAVQAF
ncbi:MAG: hypothetical protein HRT62_08765 [Epibacterium sp.]|nr:hypothetical protein [Epibacterium sp.]